MTASLVTRPYDVRMRVPNFCDPAAEPHARWPLGSTIRTLRVNAVNEGSAIAEAAMDLDRLGVRDCELVDLAEVRSIFAVCDEIEAIDGRPLPREERDRLIAPLLVELTELRAAQDAKAAAQRALAAEILRKQARRMP
jgi:hypothetical protein